MSKAKPFRRATNPRFDNLQQLQDLQCDLTAVHGLSWKEIAYQAGMREERLREFMSNRQKTVSEAEFARLRDVADKWMREGWLQCKRKWR